MHSVTLFLVGVGILGLSPLLLGAVYLIRRASDARREAAEPCEPGDTSGKVES